MRKKNKIHICAAFKTLFTPQRHADWKLEEIRKKNYIYIYIYHTKGNKKKAGIENLCARKNRLKIKTATRDKESHYTVTYETYCKYIWNSP